MKKARWLLLLTVLFNNEIFCFEIGNKSAGIFIQYTDLNYHWNVSQLVGATTAKVSLRSVGLFGKHLNAAKRDSKPDYSDGSNHTSPPLFHLEYSSSNRHGQSKARALFIFDRARELDRTVNL